MLFHPIRFVISGLITLAVLGFGGVQAMRAFDQADAALDEASMSAADEGSMLQGDRFADALGTLRAKVGDDAQVLRLTVYPTYVAAEVSTGSESKAKGYKLERDGDVVAYPVSLTGPGRLSDNVFALAKIRPQTLQAVVDGALRRAEGGAELADLTHAIAGIDPVSGRPQWSVYFSGSDFWTAKLDGSELRRGGAAAQSAGASAAAATKISQCIAEAAGNVAQIQACTR